ncbi:hypothetical protein PENTCL1PPCAC_27515, partial [Pristionchus entomophagus]
SSQRLVVGVMSASDSSLCCGGLGSGSPSSAGHLLVGAERVSSHGGQCLQVGVVGPCHPSCCWGLGSTTDCPSSSLVCSESVPTDSG